MKLSPWLVGAATSISAVTVSAAFGEASTELKWINCGDGPRYQCANLSVPLDYLNPTKDSRTASIAMTRYMAAKQPAEGTIIINPGGPGGSGTNAAYRVGPIIELIMNGTHDVLGFDPRGINMTLPRVRCMDSLVTRAKLQDILGSTAPNLNIHDVGIWDSFGQLIAEECELNSAKDVLPYVNTPSVVRDIISITDALRRQSKGTVSYWGFSYGTNIGGMLLGMFPDHLDRVILDGVRSPLDARDILTWGFTSLPSQMDVFDGYFKICDYVGPKRCALAGRDQDSKTLVIQLLTSLYKRPIPVSVGPVPGLVTYYDYKQAFYGVLYRPRNWAGFAKITADLLEGNGTSFLKANLRDIASFASSESGTAVLCTDAMPATGVSLDQWSDFVRNMSAISLIAGDSRSLDTIPCRHWKTEPNERWLGDFDNIKLDNPALIISNTYDPATPIDSGRRLASALGENAVLLEQRSFGHCSSSAVSTCTFAIIINYLKTGVLPPKGMVCETDDRDYGDYFPDYERYALIAQAMGLTPTTQSKTDLSTQAQAFGAIIDEILS